MQIAAFAVILLVLSIVTHWLIWRVRLPTRQTRALLVWLLACAPALFVGAVLLLGADFALPHSLSEMLQVALFHTSMSLAYIVTYSALEEQSPTLAIVRFIVEAGTTGRSRDDLRTIINDDTLIHARISAAVRDGLVSERDAALELSSKGRRVARMFALYRGVLGTEKGR